MIALKLNTNPSRRALSPRRSAPAPSGPQAAEARPRAARSRGRKARPAGFGWTLMGVGLFCVLAMSYVAETAGATQASYRIDALKQEQARLLANQQQTRYQISMAASAERLDGDAGRLGMVRADQRTYLPGASAPVALAHGSPDGGVHEPHSWLDQLAVALGRPAEAQAKGR